MTRVVLFRAQPFHNGHMYMINTALLDAMKYSDRVLVLVGSADKSGTSRNPIPIGVRLDLIYNSLVRAYDENMLRYITIQGLPDLSDEANNSWSWGDYLYQHMCDITKDTDFMFYYSDRPEIMLSWFRDALKPFISYKFLPRYEGVNATAVREYIKHMDDEDMLEELESMVPPFVFANREGIRKYLV